MVLLDFLSSYPEGIVVEFFTPNELSRILKLHPFTVTRLAREGKLPGFKVGGVWRFRKDEFEKWVDSRSKRKRKNW